MVSSVHTDPSTNAGLTISLLELNCRQIAERLDLARSLDRVFAIESSARREIAHFRSIARRLAEESEDPAIAQDARDLAMDFDELDHEILHNQASRYNA